MARTDAGTGRQLTAVPVRPPLCDRLPRRLGCDLVYITVDDHYVEAHTPAGSAIVLMSFSGAIADLDDYGLQVHRSYWVAYRHMQRLVQQEGRTYLRLTGGHEIPVSRTYLAAARTALGRSASAGQPNLVS